MLLKCRRDAIGDAANVCERYALYLHAIFVFTVRGIGAEVTMPAILIVDGDCIEGDLFLMGRMLLIVCIRIERYFRRRGGTCIVLPHSFVRCW